MQKTIIKQTGTFDITVVDGVKKLTGVQVRDHIEIVDDDGETYAKVTEPRETTAEELAIILGDDAATVRGANKTLNDQNTTLQARVVQLEKLLDQADAALKHVAVADEQWDTTPRAQVGEAIQAIAEAR